LTPQLNGQKPKFGAWPKVFYAINLFLLFEFLLIQFGNNKAEGQTKKYMTG
jgi:hypothetical protein